jgi:beta-phosphoglucomutase
MIKAVIFDLDGVLVTTDECHFQAWKKVADEEGIPFNWQDNQRLRGVSRMESLDIILEKARKSYHQKEKQAIADKKNAHYVSLIRQLNSNAILPGALKCLESLKRAGIRLAIGSSSKNAKIILRKLQMCEWFDAIVDGNVIKRSKPFPDIFLLAAEMLGVSSSECLVVEDAIAGIEAAKAAGMRVVAVGGEKNNPAADLGLETLQDIDLVEWILEQHKQV